MLNETYLPIKKYNGNEYTGKYEVSNLGNVRNMKTGKIIKPKKDITRTGYKFEYLKEGDFSV